MASSLTEVVWALGGCYAVSLEALLRELNAKPEKAEKSLEKMS